MNYRCQFIHSFIRSFIMEQQLPNEVLLEIALKLRRSDLLQLRRTSKRMAEITEHDCIWKREYHKISSHICGPKSCAVHRKDQICQWGNDNEYLARKFCRKINHWDPPLERGPRYGYAKINDHFFNSIIEKRRKMTLSFFESDLKSTNSKIHTELKRKKKAKQNGNMKSLHRARERLRWLRGLKNRDEKEIRVCGEWKQ